MGDKSTRILIVDDDGDLTSNLRDILEAEGYSAAVALDAGTAVNLCGEKVFDLGLIDMRLPSMSGMELTEKLSELQPRLEYIIVTGYASLESAIDAVGRRNLVAYVTKPLDMRHLLTLINQVSARKQAEDNLRESELRFRSLVENTGLAVLVTRLDGTILDCNDATAGLLGYARQQLLEMSMSRLYDQPEHRLAVVAQLERVGFIRGHEVDFRRSDGATIHVALTSAKAPLRGDTVVMTQILDITDRKKAEKQLQETNRQLERAVQGTLEVIQEMTDARDPYTSGHQRRVAELSVAIARRMGLPEESCVSLIRTAALIHDIGKIMVPAEILSKPGALSAAEHTIIRAHPQVGHDIVSRAQLPDPVPEVVLQHHERLDGSGYPRGLRGDDILPEAQILAVADVVEAMSSHRPYRPALGIETALAEISAGSGTRYYPDAVNACLAVFREKGFSFSS